MSDTAEDFRAGAEFVVGVAVADRTHRGPLIVLVVDDSEDDELVSVMANATQVPTRGFGGGWAAQVEADNLLAKFLLIQQGGAFERKWLVPGPPPELLNAAVQDHLVAVLPKELSGELSGDLEPERLGAAIIVSVPASDALTKARQALS